MMQALYENWRKFREEAEAESEDEEVDDEMVDEDREYESVRKIKRDKSILKPDRSSWVAGADDLRALSRGIAQEGEACGHNPYRKGSDGKFSTKSQAGVYTTGYSSDNKRSGDCPEQNKWQSSGGDKGSQSTRPCGRNPKTGKKYQYRCRDNAKLWNEHTDDTGMIKLEPSALEDIVSKIVQDELEKKRTITEGLKPEQIQSICHKNGYSTTEEFLRRQNAMVASAKGDLLKDKK